MCSSIQIVGIQIPIVNKINFQGLAKYTDVFLRHEVDLATFATLTEQDLKEIGIQTFGARKKLLLLANSKLHSNHYIYSCARRKALYI